MVHLELVDWGRNRPSNTPLELGDSVAYFLKMIMLPDISHIKGVVLDLDFTLSHFINGYEGLISIFERRNVTREIVSSAIDWANKTGFTINVLTGKIEADTGRLFSDREEIMEEFSKWLENSFALYEDSKTLLKHWCGTMSLNIITFGIAEHQLRKVQLAEEEASVTFSSIHVTEVAKEKWKVVQSLVKSLGSPLLYVDDDLSELDSVRERMTPEEVITIAMKRSDGPVRAPSKYEHPVITSFTELTR